MKAAQSFGTLGSAHPMSKCHASEDLDFQQHVCDNLMSLLFNPLTPNIRYRMASLCSCYLNSGLLHIAPSIILVPEGYLVFILHHTSVTSHVQVLQAKHHITPKLSAVAGAVVVGGFHHLFAVTVQHLFGISALGIVYS